MQATVGDPTLGGVHGCKRAGDSSPHSLGHRLDDLAGGILEVGEEPLGPPSQDVQEPAIGLVQLGQGQACVDSFQSAGSDHSQDGPDRESGMQILAGHHLLGVTGVLGAVEGWQD